MNQEPNDQADQTKTEPPEYELNLDDIKPQRHNWVVRGIKVSCEGANHPHHSHFLTRRH